MLESLDLAKQLQRRHLSFDFSQENALEVFKATQFEPLVTLPTITFTPTVIVEDGCWAVYVVSLEVNTEESFNFVYRLEISDVRPYAFNDSPEIYTLALEGNVPIDDMELVTLVSPTDEGTFSYNVTGYASTFTVHPATMDDVNDLADKYGELYGDVLGRYSELYPDPIIDSKLLSLILKDETGMSAGMALLEEIPQFDTKVSIRSKSEDEAVVLELTIQVNQHTSIVLVREPFNIIKSPADIVREVLEPAQRYLATLGGILVQPKVYIGDDENVHLDKVSEHSGVIVTAPVENVNTLQVLFVEYCGETIQCMPIAREGNKYIPEDQFGVAETLYVGQGESVNLVVPAMTMGKVLSSELTDQLFMPLLSGSQTSALWEAAIEGYRIHHKDGDLLYVQCELANGGMVFYRIRLINTDKSSYKVEEVPENAIEFKRGWYLGTDDFEDKPVMYWGAVSGVLTPVFTGPTFEEAAVLDEYTGSFISGTRVVESIKNRYYCANTTAEFEAGVLEALALYGVTGALAEATSVIIVDIAVPTLVPSKDSDGNEYIILLTYTAKAACVSHVVEPIKLYV